MMTILKNKIETTSSLLAVHDANAALRSVARYAWLSAGVLFACYLYFVGAITFSVIKQETLSQDIKNTISEIGKYELQYLTLQKNLTEAVALEKGFVSVDAIAYTVPASAFAWNFDGRTE